MQWTDIVISGTHLEIEKTVLILLLKSIDNSNEQDNNEIMLNVYHVLGTIWPHYKKQFIIFFNCPIN